MTHVPVATTLSHQSLPGIPGMLCVSGTDVLIRRTDLSEHFRGGILAQQNDGGGSMNVRSAL